MWDDILAFFGNPWMFTFLLMGVPFIWGFFHLGPSRHKSDDPVGKLQRMIEKEQAKVLRRQQKKKAKENICKSRNT